jgi:anti-sigma B factor antagonist
MEIQHFVNGDTIELRVTGRIDGEGANRLEEDILSIRSKVNVIYINLRGATFICSAGLRVLLQYWRQMQNSQKLLQVTTPSPEVEAILATTGFHKMLVEKGP